MTQVGAVLPVAPQVSKPADVAEKAVDAAESFDSLLSKAQTEKAADPSSSLRDEAEPQIKEEKDGKKEQENPLFRAEQMIAEPIAVALQIDSSFVDAAQVSQQDVTDDGVCAVGETVESTQVAQTQLPSGAVTENQPIDADSGNAVEGDFISQVNQAVQSETEINSTSVDSQQHPEVVTLNGAEVAVGNESEVQSQVASQNPSVESTPAKVRENQSGEISNGKTVEVDLSQVKVVENTNQSDSSFDADTAANEQTEVAPETSYVKAQPKGEETQTVENETELPQAVKGEAVGRQVKAEQDDNAKVTADEGLHSDVRVVDAYSQGNVVIEVSKEPEQVQQVSVYNQITSTVKASLEEGKKEFVMELNPESLGKVLVKLVSEGGKLTVELAAYNPKTQALLMEGSEEIRNILQAHEQRPVIVEENQNPQWYEQNSNNQNAQQQGESQSEQQGRQKENHEFTAKDFVSFMQLMKVNV